MAVYLCPTDRRLACSWEGQSEDILYHFEQEHDDLIFFNNTITVDLKVPSENRLVFMDGEIYLAQTKISMEQLAIFLRYLGPSKLAEKITYTIDVFLRNDPVNPEHISASQDGSLNVNLKSLKSFYGVCDNLECTFNINKDFDSNSFEEEVFLEEESEEEDCNSFYQTPIPATKGLSDTKRSTSLENNRIATETSLSRSKTINFEEIKRRNVVKRCNSTMSLGAIQETDADNVNCSNCGNILVPPIYLCPCGHSFCVICQRGTCKLCMEHITEERNANLEAKYNKFLHPCKFKKLGCPQKLLYNDLNQHQINCSFCEYKCPMDECTFEGQYKALSKHLKLIHGSTKILESFIVYFQNTPEVFLINEEKGIFYCYSKYFPDSVLWEARFCGPKDRRFFCELKFKEGKLKMPLLLKKVENTYSYRMTFQELKSLKLKAKNAVLTITC